MPVPTHLTEGDYDKFFPAALDEFPTVIDEQHYIDAWLLNSVFNSLLITEQYLLNHKSNIEAPLGEDIIGADGELEISIPPARYTGYETALAWDSNLLEENIKLDETIFGVVGALSAAGGGILIALPVFDVQLLIFITPPALPMLSAVPTISLPTINVV